MIRIIGAVEKMSKKAILKTYVIKYAI